ncbi:hypothetical protein [Yoonia sp.]|uniref:hypothetical protein n=1 Tax=Yoonia sp. TaxID=2212373 RepID=UPI0040479FEA
MALPPRVYFTLHEVAARWDGMYIFLIRRVHEHGVPETQAEWVGEVQEWFVKKSESGEVPDERTIRRRLTPIWKALRETC